MKTHVDLRGLAVERASSAPGSRHPRHIWARYVIPGVILAGFATLVAWAASSALRSRTPVDVVPVLATRADIHEGGAALFSAAGWVEPRPTPVQVTALAEGVVERLLVIEGQAVEAGQPVAQLIDVDARLALSAVEAELRLRESQRDSAQAALRAAEKNLDQPVELEASIAEVRAELARASTDQANLPHQIEAARARAQLGKQTLRSRRAAAEAISGLDLRRAESDEASASAELAELEERAGHLDEQVQALTKKLEAAKKRLNLKIEPTRARDEAAAALGGAEAQVAQTKVAVDEARLRLARMTVRAPISGRVLALVAQPGARMMNQATEGSRGTTVVTMYDPARLQVRADVRLEDVRRVMRGQPVRIETAATAAPINGEMISITSQADIQKNTLQVKVALNRPPEALKPDMLVQATFLAVEQKGAKNAAAQRIKLFVPKSVVVREENGTAVWIVDQAEGAARRRSVAVGQPAGGELVEITSGLQPGDKIIASGTENLRDGQAVAIARELATPGQHTEPAQNR